MMPLKLGLNPLTPDSRDLKLRDYLRTHRPPAEFGHETLVPSWGMLGNDEWGDCYFAGAAHEHMLWTAAAGSPAQFTTAGVLSDYAAATGFNPTAGTPQSNPTDQGTDMRAGAKYRQQTGIVDAAGRRHKILAYLFLEPGDYAELMLACWLFEAVGVGVVLQQAQMDQFGAGKPWEPVKGSPDVGGHYIVGAQRRVRRTIDLITWARVEAAVERFIKDRCDQACAYVTDDIFNASGLTAEHLNVGQLLDDLRQLGIVGPEGPQGQV